VTDHGDVGLARSGRREVRSAPSEASHRVIYKQWQILQRRYMHKPLGRPKSLTDEQDRQIAELRSQGLSLQKIADALGLKRSSVYSSWLRAEKKEAAN
jgi:DNA-binding NarL/FixJ family response regulator